MEEKKTELKMIKMSEVQSQEMYQRLWPQQGIRIYVMST